MENHFHSRGSIVWGSLPSAAVALQAAHEATVGGEIHLGRVSRGQGQTELLLLTRQQWGLNKVSYFYFYSFPSAHE